MAVIEHRIYHSDTLPPQSDTLSIIWQDEREGWADVASLTALDNLLAFYGLNRPPDQPPPTTLDGEAFTAAITPTTTGYRLLIQRRPQGPVQEAAWRLAEQTAMYRIIYQDDILGVLFRDENIFVPFDRLAFDAKRHKFRILE
jgi:hypothetical protein